MAKQNGTVTLAEDLTQKGREVWLAGLGAMATVEDEGTKLYNSLVEKGKELEKGSVEMFNTLVQRGKKMETQGRKQLNAAVDEVSNTQKAYTDRLETTLKDTLERFGVPTRTEVKDLTAKVNELSKKVDALVLVLEKESRRPAPKAAAAKAEAPKADARTSYHVVPREDGWAVMKEGASRATSLHDTKDEAIESARTTAKEQVPSTLVIHKKDGKIQDTFSYDA